MATISVSGYTPGLSFGQAMAIEAAGREQILALLPNGPIWNRDYSGTLALCNALGKEFGRALWIIRHTAEVELDPNYTMAELSTFEEELGLPDCPADVDLDALSIETRRHLVLTKLAMLSGWNPTASWYEETANGLGPTFVFIELGPEVADANFYPADLLASEEWPFVTVIGLIGEPDDNAVATCFFGTYYSAGHLQAAHYLYSVSATGTSGSLRCVASETKGRIFVAGTADKGFVSDSVGGTWTAASPAGDTGIHWYALSDAGTEGERFVVGGWDTGKAQASAMYADEPYTSWSAASGLGTEQVNGITRGDGDEVIAVCNAGEIYRSTDAGENYSAATSPVSDDLTAVTRCSGVTRVAVGDSGTVVRSTNGTTWTEIVGPDNPASANLAAVAGYGATLIAVGAGGYAMRSVDEGLTWEEIDTGVAVALNSVTGSPSGRWTIGGASGTLLVSTDDGDTWTQAKSGLSSAVSGLAWERPHGRAVAVTQAGDVYGE